MTKAYGAVQSSTDPTQFPDVFFEELTLKADESNGGTIYIGTDSDVSIGTDTDVTGIGYSLGAGDTLPITGPGHLSEYWHIGTSSTDLIEYFSPK